MSALQVTEDDEKLYEAIAYLTRPQGGDRAEGARLIAHYRAKHRRDALEEVLAIVCRYCARGVPMDPAQPQTVHQSNHSRGRGTSCPACRAAGIRQLMAD